MKKLIAMLLVPLVFVLSGCMIPDGIKTSLYTTEIVLSETVADAAVPAKDPWVIPPDATIEEKLAKREAQVILLVDTMEQAAKNLKAVSDYFRTGKVPSVNNANNE